MHPIEAKALGFINDDEFRSLMHGGEKSVSNYLEHARTLTASVTIPNWASISTASGRNAQVSNKLPSLLLPAGTAEVLLLDLTVNEEKDDSAAAVALAQHLLDIKPVLSKVSVSYRYKKANGYTSFKTVTSLNNSRKERVTMKTLDSGRLSKTHRR